MICIGSWCIRITVAGVNQWLLQKLLLMVIFRTVAEKKKPCVSEEICMINAVSRREKRENVFSRERGFIGSISL